MHRDNCDYTQALQESLQLFHFRVLKMRSDKLFKTTYSKKESLKLHRKTQKDIDSVKNIINI
jgi:hypothetical protein